MLVINNKAWGPLSDAYAQYSKVATNFAIKVPDALTMKQAASTLWQGFTAHALMLAHLTQSKLGTRF